MTSKDTHVQGHETQPPATDGTADLRRRKLLMMLGLAIPTAYAAPTLLSLSEAEAKDRRSRRSRRSRNRRSRDRRSRNRRSRSRRSRG